MTQRSSPSCPCCNSPSPYLLSYATVDYFHCGSCDLIFRLRSKEDGEECIRHYREDYFRTSSADQLNVRRAALFKGVIDCIEKTKKPGSLLDVGCGRGLFLQIARRRGWSVTGIDLSADSIREAEKFLEGRVFCATLNSLAADQSYDVVTLINVLDHMLDIRKEIFCIRAALKDGGLLYLRFPNGLFHSSLLRLADRMHLADVMQRLVVFHEYALTPKFTRRLLEEAGFSEVSIHNSPLAGSSVYQRLSAMRIFSDLFNQAGLLFARILDFCSGGRFIIGPSLEVTAVKSGSPIV